MNDIDGVRVYTREEMMALLDKAYELMGEEIDTLPNTMTLGELDVMVNGQVQ